MPEAVGTSNVTAVAHLGFNIVQRDANETNNATCCDKSAGEERAWSYFTFLGFFSSFSRLPLYQPANYSSHKHCTSRTDGNIETHRKRQRPDTQQLDRNNHEDTQQNKSPGETLVQYPANHRCHEARLRRRGFIAADALHPLYLDRLCSGVIEVFAIRDLLRAERIQ